MLRTRFKTLRRPLIIAGVLSLLASTGLQQAPAEANLGEWSGPFSENGSFVTAPPQTPDEANELPTAVSAVVLADGKVLYWDGLAGLANCSGPLAAAATKCNQPDQSRVMTIDWDETYGFTTPASPTGGQDAATGEDQLFCADQRLLADGRVVATGGTSWRNDPVDATPYAPDAPVAGTTELFGSKATRFFGSGDWSLTSPMHQGRWYPTLLTLPNGKLFVASGVGRLLYNDKGTNVLETEVFDASTGAWSLNPPNHNQSLPLYARLHVLPDGKIFFGGAGQMFNPFGQSYDEATWNFHKIYDPSAGSDTPAWTDSGIGAVGARGGAFSVMLPLKAPFTEANILVGGGTIGTSPGTYLGTNLSEIITVKDGKSTSALTSPLNNPRWYSSGVLLPDGTVVALNGGDRDDVVAPGTTTGVRQPELFDPATGTWTRLASGLRDRTYHNSAILLADGSILVGGHSPINTLYGDKGQPAYGPISSNLRDPSFERFYPPYLNRGDRPSITSAPAGITWGSSFNVTSADAGDISKVALVRLPSATHTTDPDMRSIELASSASGNTLTIASPPNANVAPPGFYYLFLMKDNGQGLTPSNARIVRVSSTGDISEAPAPFGN
ncbi:MAG TPA: galactose oxidase-like domain-containing protein [Actinomycetota bacterium]|nr:galactose oxidase-like domain-containing protein [Actinomycetota bacterium]